MNMAVSWGAKHVLFFFNHSRQIGERFITTFAKLKVVSPTAMAKLAIDSASLESLVINWEIFIPNQEIVITILKIRRSPAKSGDLAALLSTLLTLSSLAFLGDQVSLSQKY